ncbi:MAG: caspase family protein, partial [Bacteroidota bacterium]
MKAFHCALFLLALLFLFALESSAQKIQREGQDYALFFAVSDYEDGTLPKLPNSITDAIKIAGVLEKNYDFKTEILENPTLDEIDDKLHEYQDNFLNNTFDRKGQLFIFFSGHGVKDYDNGYFLPVDANPERLLRTALAYDTWRPLISEIAAQHILVAVDACYSVTFDPSWQSKANPRFKRIGEMSEDDRIVANHKAYKNRVFFTADARENTVPGRSNFARKLYEGLLFYRNEDVPFVTSSELYGTFVKKAQPSPRAGHFEGDQAESSFLFFPKNENTIDPNQFSAREKDMAAYEAIRNAPSLSKCDQYLQDFPYG